MLTIFWAASALLLYVYFGYPLLIALWAKLRPNPPLPGSHWPSISILLIAHNEARNIGAKIENLLALDYGPQQIDITIVSDGSNDETVSNLEACTSAGSGESVDIRVLAFDERRGKPSILNEIIPGLRGEIVVLMDARQRVSDNALRTLTRHFTDPLVGAVSGELLLSSRDTHVGDASDAEGDTEKGDSGQVDGVGFYWHYEKFIRRQEAAIDSSVGATGALYAFRRKLYRPIDEDTLLDDVLVPMNIVRQGYRVLFEPQALAHDRLAESPGAEFTRKVRTLCGNYQLFVRHPWLLNPFVNRIFLQTFSHKFLRLMGPVLLMVILACTLVLLESPFFQLILLLQVAFYSLALIGHLGLRPFSRWKAVSIPYAFCLLNWAAWVGLIRFVRNSQKVTWRRVG